jgi:O-antigen/teichoic acid export membrane protein
MTQPATRANAILRPFVGSFAALTFAMATGLVTSVLVARRVGPGAFGEIGLLMSLVSLASVTGVAAVGPILSVRVAERHAHGESPGREIASGVALSSGVGLAIGLAILVVPSNVFGVGGDPIALAATAMTMAILGFAAALRFALQGLGRAIVALWIWSLASACLLAATLMVGAALSAATYMLLYLVIQAGLPSVAFLVALGRRARSWPSLTTMREMAWVAIPVVLWGVSITMGQVLSRRLLIESGAGVFQAALLLQQPFATAMTALAATFLPALGAARVLLPDRGTAVTSRVLVVSVGLSIALAGAILPLGPLLVDLLYGRAFTAVSGLLAPVVTGGVLLVAAAVCGQRLIADRRTLPAAGTAALWLVAWAAAALLLGPATPWSMSVAQAVGYGAMAGASYFLLRGELSVRLVEAVLAGTGLTVLVAAIVRPESTLVDAVIALAAGCALAVMGASRGPRLRAAVPSQGFARGEIGTPR